MVAIELLKKFALQILQCLRDPFTLLQAFTGLITYKSVSDSQPVVSVPELTFKKVFEFIKLF